MARNNALERIKRRAYGATSDKLSALERIKSRTQGVGGYSYYSIDKWQKDNEDAINVINGYQSKIQNGDWMSSEDRQAYKSAIDKYTTSATNLRDLNRKLGTSYTADEEKSWNDSLSSLQSGYNSVNDFYGQFANDKVYGNWKRYESPIDDVDYDKYVDIGKSTANPNWNQAHAPLDIGGWQPFGSGESVNNMVTFAEANKNAGVVNAMQGTGDKYSEIINLINQHMTPEEKSRYNYYVGKDDTAMANEYLDYMSDVLRQRAGGQIAVKADNNGLELLTSGLAGLQTAVSGYQNFLHGIVGGDGPVGTTALQYAHGQTAGNNEGAWKVLNDLSHTTGNMVPSIALGTMATFIAGPAAGKAVGSIATGISSAGNSYAEMINEGYGTEQAVKYGLAVGAAEGGLSYLFAGIEALGGRVTGNVVAKVVDGIDNGIARFVADIAINSFSEGFEEGMQAILEPSIKKWATGEEYEGIDWSEVGYSAMLGAMSAGLLEGVPRAQNTIKTTHNTNVTHGGLSVGGAIETMLTKDAKLSEAFKQGQANVTNSAGEYANYLTQLDADNKAAKYVQDRIGQGKNVSGYQINRLASEIDTALTNNDTAAIKTAVENRLTELGETGDVSAIADVIARETVGEELSFKDRAVLNKSTKANIVLTEMMPENIKGGNLANKWAEGIGTKRVNADVYNLREATDTPNTESSTVAKVSASGERVSPTIVTKNAEGKTVKSEISGIEVDGDKATFTLANGEKVSADKAIFQTDKQKLVADIAVEKVSRVEGFSTEAATAMVKGYDGKMDVSDYNAAINDAYRYGYQGISINEISLGKNTSLVADKAPLYVAYDVGRQYAKSNFTRPTFLGTKKATAIGSVTLAKSIDQTKLNKAQKTQLKALDVVAAGLGVNINVYESNVNAEGQRIGENGRYHVETHTIDVDLNSGAKGEGLMLNTAAHEITHHVKAVASDKFKAFADAVFEEFGNRGQQVDALVEVRVQKMRGQKKYAEFTEAQLYDRAYEEVVADAAESMLTDSDALVKLANKIKAKDHSLWESVKNFINKLVKDIKRIYKDLSPDSFEGAFVRDMGDAAERLQKLWVEGVMAASEVDLTETISEETMVGIDAGSESVSPVMLSERTWTASEYVTAREEMAKKIANALGVSVNKAKKYIDDVNSIAKLIANDRARLDYEASSFGSAFVSNVEYGGSFDYTTLCKKRRIYTGTFTEIQKRLRNTALTPDDILKIGNLLIDEGVEATCGLCYVEGSRANMGKFSQKFIELYKRDFPDAWIPDMADVNTPDGVEKMRIKHPEVYERYEYFWNHYGKLQDSDPALFASQQKPKLYEARKEYKGEILTQFKKDSSIEKKNLNGGIRMQSFSDFEIVHLIDTMQVIMDMSTVGLAGQAYTKVPEFAKAFGNTGLKINLSLIAKGVDADGRLIFDDREGMPHETAFELRNQYSKNVGTIIVTFTDEQLMAAMADERIDFIIPFHRSQWKKGQYGAMGLPKGTKDYTFMQNEKLIRQTYHEYQGRLVKDKATNYMPNEYWDFSKSGKENAEAYLKMCAENNKRPKFYKLLDHDGDGTYSLKADGSTDGYWKLLVDFKMYDNNGVGSPQAQVVPKFNMEESYKMLKEYEGGHAQYPVAQGVVDKFVSEYGKADNVMYSERRDFSYGELIKKGDMIGTVINKTSQVPMNNKFIDSKKIISIVRSQCEVVHTKSASPKYYLYVPDIEKNVEIIDKSITHGFFGGIAKPASPSDIINAKVSMDLKNVLKNSIEVNQSSRTGNIDIPYSHVMMGTIGIENSNGNIEYYAVRSVIEARKNLDPILVEAKVIGKLHAVNAKKIDSPNLKVATNSVARGHGGAYAYSIAQFLDDVKGVFTDTFSDDVYKQLGTTREETPFSDNLIYQDRLTPEDAFSNRALLARALESVATNDAEREKLKQYKNRVDMLNRESFKLSKINEEIKELTFGKGEKNPARLKELNEEKIKTSNRINLHDKKLLSLEATKSLKDVLDREKKKAYKAAAEKGREALHRNVEGRHKTAERHAIKALKDKFIKMMDHPTDKQYIPANLISAMVDVCQLIDTDTNLYKMDGSINKAQQKRNEQMDRLLKLRDEYAALGKNPDPMYSGEFDQDILEYLDELRQDYTGKSLDEMTLVELKEFRHILRAIDETLQDARKLIGWGEADSVYDAGDRIIDDQRAITKKRKGKGENTATSVVIDNSLSPLRNVKRMADYKADSPLVKIFRDLEVGVRRKNKFAMDAYKSFDALTSGANAKKYEDAIYKPYGKEYVDKEGRKFRVSKMEMMQAIMSYNRELANDKLKHVSDGGFTFADLDLLNKGKLKEAIDPKNAHTVNLGAMIAMEFQSALAKDSWAQEYMKTAEQFFDGTAKDAINEANMTLKHRIIATGSKYIPYEVNKDFVVREITSENDIQQTISGYGMMKDLKDGATQPLIITGLNNILERHIDQVSNIHGLAVPVRNFNKIWNVKAQDGSTTVQEAIKRNFGDRGAKVMIQAVKDVQGSRIKSEGERVYSAIKGNVIGATFMGNGSVVTKQVGSLFTATAKMKWRDPVSMIGNLLYTMANYKKISAEVDKYTASAWMRRQGMSDAELHSLTTEAKKKGIVRLVSKLPTAINPTKWISGMDSMVALSLWTYAKADVAKQTGLSGEDLNKAAAEYYDDIIENTQSMSDALHRPEIQKSGGVISETLGTFKTDLYQGAGLMADALGEYRANPTKENANALAKAVTGNVMSAVWGSIMTTAFALLRYKVNRYRDDEDDEIDAESWLKVQGSDLAGDLVGYIVPLFGGEVYDIVSAVIKGEQIESFDNMVLEAINDFVNACVGVGNAVRQGDWANETAYKKLINSIGSIFGVPISNMTRLWEAINLHAQDIANGEFMSFEAGLTSPNNTRLYRAYIEGDADKINKASRLYKDEAALKAGLRKGLRENDPRLREAAIAKLNGDNATYNRLRSEVIAEGKFDRTIVEDAFAAEYNSQKNKADEEGK